MYVALAAFSGFEIELKVRVSPRSLANVLKSTFRKRCPPQVRVQDDSGCVDYRPQRIIQRPAQFVLNRRLDTGKSKRQLVGINVPGRNFVTQAAEHRAARIRDRGLSILRDQRDDFRIAEE